VLTHGGFALLAELMVDNLELRFLHETSTA
jgi:hypothetical protein